MVAPDANGDATTYLLDTVRAFFDGEEWEYEQVEGETILRLGYATPEGLVWSCYAQTFERDEQFVFYSVPPLMVAEDRRAAVAEYVTRANFGLRLGNFELDLDDGEIRFRAGIDVEGDLLSTQLVRQMVYASISLMERYLPGLLAVINLGADPHLTIDEIETP